MQTIEYKNPKLEKESWGQGPWQSEPDKKQWLDESTGLPCLIVRSNNSGSLCGYVGVPKTHSYYEKEYGELDLEVHGDLTFSGKCHKAENECEGICHIAEEEDIWWLGFDTAHYLDLMPARKHYEEIKYGIPTVYRDFEYVTAQVEQLAKQLKEV